MLRRNPHDHLVYALKLSELEKLATTAGYEIVDRIIQTRRKPHSKFVVGKGKLEELKGKVKEKEANFVIFYENLTSSQKLALMRETGCEVIDRYELTLEIFDLQASDKLSKLQIELARLNKLFPFYKLQASIQLKTEHPFFRGMGEYAYHRRITGLKRKIKRLKEEIARIKWRRMLEIEKRKRLGMPIICITGYYNAGKTTLFNALTGERKPVSDMPFTTLSSKYQRRYFGGQMLLFVDTIGFVIDIDPELVESFELNLLDMRAADILLYLLELSDPVELAKLKLKHGISLLRRLEIPLEKIIFVLNKADLLHEDEIKDRVRELLPFVGHSDWCVISAKERRGLDALLEKIREKLGVEVPSYIV